MAEKKMLMSKSAFDYIVDKIRLNTWSIRENTKELGKEAVDNLNPFIDELFDLTKEFTDRSRFEIRSNEDAFDMEDI